jgi:hypothetical protein
MAVSTLGRKCATCGRLNPPVALFCQNLSCRRSLRFVEPAMFEGLRLGEHWTTAQAEHRPDGDAPPDRAPSADDMAAAPQPGPEPAPEPIPEPGPEPSPDPVPPLHRATRREFPPYLAMLRFPWGEVPVEPHLPVGRDPQFSPQAGEIGHPRYLDTVSNRHAAFTVDEAGLVIVDVGSTNGTFVNGARLVAHQSYRLAAGDRIRFGQRVEVEVAVLQRMGG